MTDLADASSAASTVSRRSTTPSAPDPERPGAGPRHLLLRAVVAVVVLALVFGVALPQTADYGEAWDLVRRLDGRDRIILVLLAIWNLFTYWPVMMLSLPGLRLREAAVVNQASTAVANTVPAGSALAVAVSYRILRRWGFTSESIANQVLATGTWNLFVKLTLPFAAVGLLATQGELEARQTRLAAWGLLLFAALVVAAAVLLRADATTRRVGAALDRRVDRVLQRFGRHRAPRDEPWLVSTRRQMVTLVQRVAVRLSVAAFISHLSLYLVLLGSLRLVGITPAQASDVKILAAFAFVRLLSAAPLTPGGVGLVELGYVAVLTTGAASELGSEVAAGVLLFRAVTYVLPMVLGSLSLLALPRLTSWNQPADSRGPAGAPPRSSAP